jgi:hypothetical protein
MSNHQLEPWFFLMPWAWPWYGLWLAAKTVQDLPEVVDVIRDRQ